MTTIGFSAELTIDPGTTTVKDIATWLNRLIDIPAIGETVEQMLFERSLSMAETIAEHNLPHIVEAANAIAERFSVGPVRLSVYSKSE